MTVRNFLVICLVVLTGAAIVDARTKNKKAESWSEPFGQWSHDHATELLKDSPWAQSQKLASIINTKTAGEAGEKDLYYIFTARFFSALPVRESYVRLYQIMNNYQSMSPEDQDRFNTKFKRALDLDTSNRVIVALEFSTNDPQASRSVMNFLSTATRDTFKLNTFLVSDRVGRVDLAEYYPPSTDGTGAKFIFPRVFNGQQVVLPEDKMVKLDFHIPMSVFSRPALSASPSPDAPSSGASVAISSTAGGPTSASVQGDLSPSDAISGPSIERQSSDERILLTFDVDKMIYQGHLTY